MKKLRVLLSIFASMNTCFAQVTAKKNRDVGKVYFSPQVPPSFPGGETAWQRFVASSLDTNIAAKNGAPASIYTVTLSFIVGMDSAVSNVTCKNDPGHGMCQRPFG